MKTATAAVIAAAVVLCVAAGGYGLFVALGPVVGAAWAAALVALAAAVLAILAIVVARIVGAEDPRYATKSRDGGLNEQLIDLAMDRPIAMAAVAVVVGLILWRNPSLLTTAAGVLGPFGGRRR